MQRVITRFLDRAQGRDPSINQNLNDLFMKSRYEESSSQNVLDIFEGIENADVGKDGTVAIREYMLRESEQQYKDYYESDEEEQGFFEYLNNMSQRDKL